MLSVCYGPSECKGKWEKFSEFFEEGKIRSWKHITTDFTDATDKKAEAIIPGIREIRGSFSLGIRPLPA